MNSVGRNTKCKQRSNQEQASDMAGYSSRVSLICCRLMTLWDIGLAQEGQTQKGHLLESNWCCNSELH